VNRLTKEFPGAVLLVVVATLIFYGSSLTATFSEDLAPEESAWSSIGWPFPVDAWPEGRAFHCGFAKCGMNVNLYIRSKVGFCDCFKGVSDDDEIDRIGDLAILNGSYAPLAPGTIVNLGGMQGRARKFIVSAPNQTKQYALGIALSRQCDAIVATAVGDNPLSSVAEDRVFELLNSNQIKDWINDLPQS